MKILSKLPQQGCKGVMDTKDGRGQGGKRDHVSRHVHGKVCTHRAKEATVAVVRAAMWQYDEAASVQEIRVTASQAVVLRRTPAQWEHGKMTQFTFYSFKRVPLGTC